MNVLLTPRMKTGLLADINHSSGVINVRQNLITDEPIVQHDVCSAHKLHSAQGQQARVAGPCTDKMHDGRSRSVRSARHAQRIHALGERRALRGRRGAPDARAHSAGGARAQRDAHMRQRGRRSKRHWHGNWRRGVDGGARRAREGAALRARWSSRRGGEDGLAGRAAVAERRATGSDMARRTMIGCVWHGTVVAQRRVRVG